MKKFFLIVFSMIIFLTTSCAVKQPTICLDCPSIPTEVIYIVDPFLGAPFVIKFKKGFFENPENFMTEKQYQQFQQTWQKIIKEKLKEKFKERPKEIPRKYKVPVPNGSTVVGSK